MNADCREIAVEGLRYRLRPESFLNEQQAVYALRQLWRIAVGNTVRCATPLIHIESASKAEVGSLFRAVEPIVDWVSVDSVLPTGTANPFDSAQLPVFPIREMRRENRLPNGEFPFDLVSMTFLMLSRWEEVNLQLRLDEHGRTKDSEMLACRAGFHDRPIVDQWCVVLRSWLRLFGIRPAPRQSNVVLTHDLDRPVRYPSLYRIFRGAAGEFLQRRKANLFAAGREFRQGVQCFSGVRHDPYLSSIVDLASVSEAIGTRGRFYVMTADARRYDEGYPPNQGRYYEILQDLSRRGHEIGWHPGYDAATDADRYQTEKQRMDQLGFGSRYGGRHHYLRWTPAAWDQWAAAGLLYDSSVGFARTAGFRAGTCHPYPVYSLKQNRALDLIERPLLIMDVALTALRQQGQDVSALVDSIMQRAHTVGGEAVLLVHNCFNDSAILKMLFEHAHRTPVAA